MAFYVKQTFTAQYGKTQVTIKSTSLVLICSKFWIEFVQKQTNLSSKVVPMQLDFSVGKSMARVSMQIYISISNKIWTQLIKTE